MQPIIEKKRVTIHDVAAIAGVTKSTVSQVLAGKGNYPKETRERIQKEARRLKYEPDPLARRLSSGYLNKEIALFTLLLDLHVSTKKLQRLQELLVSQGFEVPVYACGSGAQMPNVILRSLRQQRPRAIVVNSQGLTSKTLHELELYQGEGGILVCYDGPAEINCDKVIFDREDNSYQATRHLLELGHRDIGFCSPGINAPIEPRLKGFCRALDEFKAPLRKAWLIDTDSPHTLYEHAGSEMAAKFLRLKKRPTAVCVGDDYTAVCFAAALERGGVHVPSDVSVVGHDDSPIAGLGPLLLTTVTHPAEEIVAHTVELLNTRLQGYSGPPREVVIGSQLIIRESSAPPKKSKKRIHSAKS